MVKQGANTRPSRGLFSTLARTSSYPAGIFFHSRALFEFPRGQFPRTCVYMRSSFRVRVIPFKFSLNIVSGLSRFTPWRFIAH